MNEKEVLKITEALNWLNNPAITDEYKVERVTQILCEILGVKKYSDLFNVSHFSELLGKIKKLNKIIE
jgi:hypothetical protein